MKHMYIDWKGIDHQLKDLIFKQFSDKGILATGDLHNTNLRSDLLAQKGVGVLERMAHDSGSTVQFQNLADNIRFTVHELEFDHNLLIWHIATDLCYSNDPLNFMRSTTLLKGFSDIDLKYQDACEEVRHYLPDEKSSSQACLELIQISPAGIAHRLAEAHAASGAPSVLVERASKYMLIDGCKLARKLKGLLDVGDDK